MIDETFLHCPGIGPVTEKRLQQLGFQCWEDCLIHEAELPFSGDFKTRFLETLVISLKALEADDLVYFTSRLPPREHWRILARYFTESTFFDIETSGLSSYDSTITVISAFFQGQLYTFRHDETLHDFLQLIDQSTLLVTFNGNCFDIPFLENTFNIPTIGCPAIDLRWICYHAGYSGGLKSIERQLSIVRPSEIQHLDGFEAVLLFERWQAGDDRAGRQLIRYCESDVLATYLTAGRVLQDLGIPIALPDGLECFRQSGIAFPSAKPALTPEMPPQTPQNQPPNRHHHRLKRAWNWSERSSSRVVKNGS